MTARCARPRFVLSVAVLLASMVFLTPDTRPLCGGEARAQASPADAVLTRIAPEERGRLQAVTEHASVVGRVRGEAFELPREIFEYLLDHPEFGTHVMRAARAGRYRVWREADGLWVEDGRGAVGRFTVVHVAAGARVVYLSGRYEGRFLPAIHGRAVGVLQYAAPPLADGKHRITPVLTGFVKIDNAVVDFVSRLLSGIAAAAAEKLARRIVADFARTARALESDPAGIDEALGRRPEVPQRELAEFRRLLRLP